MCNLLYCEVWRKPMFTMTIPIRYISLFDKIEVKKILGFLSSRIANLRSGRKRTPHKSKLHIHITLQRKAYTIKTLFYLNVNIELLFSRRWIFHYILKITLRFLFTECYQLEGSFTEIGKKNAFFEKTIFNSFSLLSSLLTSER